MTFFTRLAGFSSVLLLSSALGAGAATTASLTDSSVQGPGNTANIYGGRFDGSTPVGGSWFNGTGDALGVAAGAPVVTPPPGNSTGNYQSPFNNTFRNDTQSYFSVGGSSGGNGGGTPLTLSLGTAVSSLDLLWGSIDDYNEIEFFDAGGASLGAFGGADIVSDFSLGGSGPSFERVALLNFAIATGDNPISFVTFSSTTAAFEFGLATTTVPAPAAGLLMLTGLAGLGFVSRRRRARA